MTNPTPTNIFYKNTELLKHKPITASQPIRIGKLSTSKCRKMRANTSLHNTSKPIIKKVNTCKIVSLLS